MARLNSRSALALCPASLARGKEPCLRPLVEGVATHQIRFVRLRAHGTRSPQPGLLLRGQPDADPARPGLLTRLISMLNAGRDPVDVLRQTVPVCWRPLPPHGPAPRDACGVARP